MTLAVEYAKEREQFGRPIGSFQAVQHLCADMLQSVELGRAAAYYACWACDAGDPKERRRAAAMAVGVRGRRLLPGRGVGDPGLRRRRLHLGARHAPLLQATAHPPAVRRSTSREARGTRLGCPRRRRGAVDARGRPIPPPGAVRRRPPKIATSATDARTTRLGSAGSRRRKRPYAGMTSSTTINTGTPRTHHAKRRRCSTTTPPIARIRSG